MFGFFRAVLPEQVTWTCLGSLLVEAFKSQLDKAMARDDLVLAGDWTRDF